MNALINPNKRLAGICLAAVLGAMPALALAQSQAELPDAGRILQDTLPEPVEPAPAPLELRVEAQDLSEIAPGGAQVQVDAVRFEGNTRFSQDQLREVLGAEVLGERYDLSGLRSLANRISVFYREAGYSFARAFVPVQDLEQGELLIQVVEGRYGRVEFEAEDERLTERVKRYLSQLIPGEVINQNALERAFAILGDVPGVAVSPAIVAGSEPGTGDVLVRIEEDAAWSGSLGLDNHGNRFSGEYRGVLRASRPMVFTFGDKLDVTALYSSESLLLGSTQYSLPLGTSGLRGQIGYNHTDYELGQGADAQGDAKTTSVGVSYPLLRSPTANLSIAAEYQYKDLSDTFAEGQATRATSADVVPLTLRFDRRDGFAGGGISYGSLSLSMGETSRREDLAGDIGEQDISFSKLNLELVRLQSLSVLPEDWNVYASVSAQTSDTTLDSSETKSLGGASGVRAYPQGEGTGSEAIVTQFELRASLPPLSPYLFADYGYVPQRGEDEVRRSLAGAGVGVRGSLHGISGDLSVAWKLDGEAATSDTREREPRIWFSLSYAF